MKTKIISLMLVAAALLLTTKLIAQNPIPSYNVPVVADPTTFEESPDTTARFGLTGDALNQIRNEEGNRAEKKLKIKVELDSTGDPTWALVIAFSVNGQNTLGPFFVQEGETLEIGIDSQTWGVLVSDASSNCFLSVWID